LSSCQTGINTDHQPLLRTRQPVRHYSHSVTNGSQVSQGDPVGEKWCMLSPPWVVQLRRAAQHLECPYVRSCPTQPGPAGGDRQCCRRRLEPEVHICPDCELAITGRATCRTTTQYISTRARSVVAPDPDLTRRHSKAFYILSAFALTDRLLRCMCKDFQKFCWPEVKIYCKPRIHGTSVPVRCYINDISH